MKEIKIKDYFKSKEQINENNNCILVKMQGDWNDGDYVNTSIYLPLSIETLASLYLLEVLKEKEIDKIKDYSGEIFEFLNNYFILNIPKGYESDIHTLKYDLIYINEEGKRCDIELIKDLVPEYIKEWIHNIQKVQKITGYYYYNNDLLKAIIELYDTNKISKTTIEKLIDNYSYDYFQNFELNDLIENKSQFSREELIEHVYEYLNNI